MASDEAPFPIEVKDEDWSRLEYEELNRYGRTVYETFFRLTQMTFIINPALGAGFYYVFFEKHETVLREPAVGFAAPAIAFFGVVYNFGAFGVYVRTHAYLEALLMRIREIDWEAGTTIHIAMKATAPYSYRRFWKAEAETRAKAEARRSEVPSDTPIVKGTAPDSNRRFWGARTGWSTTPSDTLIKIFVLALATCWAMALTYASWRLTPFTNNNYLLLAVGVTFAIFFGVSAYMMKAGPDDAGPVVGRGVRRKADPADSKLS